MNAGENLTVHGYRHSIYTRAVLLTLAEKGIPYRFDPIDPFDAEAAEDCRALHPFGRVPALSNGGFTLYETAAILRYLDMVFPDPRLTPRDAKAAARMAQVMCIADSYGYWPMVRQVFAHRVVRPSEGLQADESEIAQGLLQAAPVLTALDVIAAEGWVLDGAQATLGDCHLAPIMAAFTAAREGAQMLTRYPALSGWWSFWAKRTTLRNTDTGFDRTNT